jgi:hypothetical protein
MNKIVSAGALLAVVAVVAALAATTASAKDYTVGGSDRWDTYVDYGKWTAGKTFMVGDTISACYCYAATSLLLLLALSVHVLARAFPSHLILMWRALMYVIN